MSVIDFKSFLIGILIAIIFVFTTGISLSGGGKYMTRCAQAYCFVLNTETGVGKYVATNWSDADTIFERNGFLKSGTKLDF